MSIQLILRRMTRADYERARHDGVLYAEHTGQLEDISKSWDELRRVLAGGDMDDPPLEAQALCGGDVLPNDDMEYGGVRLIPPERVAEISHALSELTEPEFRRRYERTDFTGAYSSGPGAQPGRTVDELLSLRELLGNFYAEAARHGEAVGYWYG
ncbi:DUF1877 family protein [Catellatospora citrea]|uniref:DUF1877 family protein n=1 Tax=Catellatospora citrea TaxID=53366 RepID=UPI0033C6D320